MGVSEFYDSVVLRDFLEYTAPGAIVISAVGLSLEVFNAKLDLELSPIDLFLTHPWPALAFIIFPAYIIGHVLTAINAWVGRVGEQKIAAQVLNDDDWFRLRFAQVVAVELQISTEECLTILKDPVSAETLREIGRSVAHRHAGNLYREFIGRHSILSRFCQNMVVAMGVSVWLVFLSAWILWVDLSGRARLIAPLPLWLVAVTFLGLTCLSMVALSRRSLRLRKTMTKHTFQIWYLVSAECQLRRQRPTPGLQRTETA
ncbi:MAG TPA: hypothetical protein VGX68_22765 [Thermoanaerobaculia bacterium]|jgi:hypothetical protein|nr:hypothetical protein [Thermoanaerobaculia bacterium]